MKALTSGLIYLGTYSLVFFLLSLIAGVLFGYGLTNCLHNQGWQISYSLFLGWWVGIPICMEYDEYCDAKKKP